MSEMKLKIFGMNCNDCAITIERSLNSMKGVNAKVNYEKREALVYYDDKTVGENEILMNPVFSEKTGYRAMKMREL
ncbi:heavy-metal-associated domain-containing protein [Caldiplasma sukawensis]